jgi:hypothetical protein
MPAPEPIRHPITGEPIAQGPGEQLQRIGWPGAPVLVLTRPGPAGELLYRLARPSGQTWNPAAGLCFELWPAAAPLTVAGNPEGPLPATDALAVIAAAVFGPPLAWPGILRPRPPYLPHPCRRLPGCGKGGDGPAYLLPGTACHGS